MSDAIKHECGIALIRLLKPLSYYKENYGSTFYGIHKMYLMMEKQHNRGQDGAGFASIKLNMKPGERYISRVRSRKAQPIQDIFSKINTTINERMTQHPDYREDIDLQKKNIPYLGEVFLGHLRYGTFGANNIENVHPFLRQNNWMHRNLIVAGNFNMTNAGELFNDLVQLGQYPKERSDTVTIMERIGHFLDDAVEKLYKEVKKEGYTKIEASPLIEERLNMSKVLKKSAKNWDGGYVIAGLLGHGDSFVLRDPHGIRPAYYYKDDEIVVVASERPAIQTVFNVDVSHIEELSPGHAIITKKNGETALEEIIPPLVRKACSFERIYFSRGNDTDIYKERKKLGRMLLPKILDSVNHDLDNTVFSYIPNTAETAFLGLVEEVQKHLNHKKETQIIKEGPRITQKRIRQILSAEPRVEKIAIKDVKLRTFIAEDNGRDDLVTHVYDVTYGVVKSTDNLVIIDDSIVRGTTLKKSILRILDRLQPKAIIVVSSAPQIRYPDCYGIDMARMEDLIAFRAALALHKDRNTYHIVEDVYKKCKQQAYYKDNIIQNKVKEIYAPFTPDMLSEKIGVLLSTNNINAPVKIIFQTVDNLHRACPANLGDWYFTGNYPTPGGNRIVNKAFMNFYEGNKERAY